MSSSNRKYDINPRPSYDFYYIEVMKFMEDSDNPKPLIDISRWIFKDLDSATKAYQRLKSNSRHYYPLTHIDEKPNTDKIFEWFSDPIRRVYMVGGYYSDSEEDFEE